MAQTIKLKRTAVQGKIPTTSNLDLGELAINTYDGRIFFEKDVDGTLSIQEILTTNSQNSGSFNLVGGISASLYISASSFSGDVDYSNILFGGSGVVSGSEQINVTDTVLYSSLATTGSNTYTSAQTILNETVGQNHSLVVGANSTGDRFRVTTDNTAGAGIILSSRNSNNTSDTKLSFSGSSFEFGGGDVNILGNLTLGGNITIGDSTTDSITVSADFSSSLIPDSGSTYDLGSSSKPWNEVHGNTFHGDGSGLTGIQVDQVASVTASFSNQSTINVSHNFDTRNVLVSTYDSSYNQLIPQTVSLTDSDTVQVVLSAAHSGHVVVAKGGHVVSGSTEADNISGLGDKIQELTSYRKDVSGSSFYTITHGLNERYPFVQAWNTSNNTQEQPLDIESIHVNQLTVSFSANFAGKIIVKK